MSSKVIYNCQYSIEKFLEEDEMIKGLFEYIKNGTFPNNNQSAYISAYLKVKEIASAGDNASEALFEYHNKKIQQFIEDCYKIVSSEATTKLIDSFIKQTENINNLIYWMNRIFTYLDDYYDDEIDYKRLSIVEMDLYKENFFDTIEEKVYKEINKLIKEDRNNNIVERLFI